MSARDLVAGLTTGVVLVAQAVAYASLAGLPPATGLYGALVAPLVYAAIGRSDVLSAGPTAISSLLVGTAVAGQPDALAHATLLAAMVGIVQLAAMVLRLDRFATLVTPTVLRGFLAAAALRIGWSQAPALLGWSGEWGGGLDPVTAAVGGAALLCLLLPLPEKLERHGALRTVLVMALFTVASFLFAFPVSQVGALPEGLPMPELPPFELGWASVASLTFPALVIALLSFIEGIGAAGARPQELESRRELAALGLANWGSALVGGYPVSGGLSRTAVNAQAGAGSRLAGVISSAVVALVLLAGGALLAPLPDAVLAAVVTAGVLSLVDREGIRGSDRRERWVLVGTFVPTLLVGVGFGVAVGALVAALTRRYGDYSSAQSSGEAESSSSSSEASLEPPPSV